MYYIDYHTHTKLSPDGEVPLAAMAEAASPSCASPTTTT